MIMKPNFLKICNFFLDIFKIYNIILTNILKLKLNLNVRDDRK